MVIEYSYARISLISSYIITNKTLIFSLFYKRQSESSYFSAQKRTWSESILRKRFRTRYKYYH